MRLPLPALETDLTICVGVDAFHDDAAIAEALLKAADASLYSAKAGGRNRGPLRVLQVGFGDER